MVREPFSNSKASLKAKITLFTNSDENMYV